MRSEAKVPEVPEKTVGVMQLDSANVVGADIADLLCGRKEKRKALFTSAVGARTAFVGDSLFCARVVSVKRASPMPIHSLQYFSTASINLTLLYLLKSLLSALSGHIKNNTKGLEKKDLISYIFLHVLYDAALLFYLSQKIDSYIFACGPSSAYVLFLIGVWYYYYLVVIAFTGWNVIYTMFYYGKPGITGDRNYLWLPRTWSSSSSFGYHSTN